MVLDHGGPSFSNGMMVWSTVNYGQIVMVIFSQFWSSLIVDDPVILTMVRTWLIGPLKFKKIITV